MWERSLRQHQLIQDFGAQAHLSCRLKPETQTCISHSKCFPIYLRRGGAKAYSCSAGGWSWCAAGRAYQPSTSPVIKPGVCVFYWKVQSERVLPVPVRTGRPTSWCSTRLEKSPTITCFSTSESISHIQISGSQMTK